MSTGIISLILVCYFIVLILVSFYTSKNVTTDDFFTAKRQSPWYLVAFGMIGTSISGATFISVPGKVHDAQFSYFQIILGQFVGLLVIIYILLPLYYRLNLVSIYTYLERRFGAYSYKTGSLFFIISRTAGASIRLFLAAAVLQKFIFDKVPIPFAGHFIDDPSKAHIPFELTVFITIALIWVYTIKGGIKTIVWTDSLQTLFLVTALIVSIIFISGELGWQTSDLFSNIYDNPYSKVFFLEDTSSKYYFWKNFISGIFLTIAMTGLDQDLMQKNLTCKDYNEAKKNMLVFSVIMIVVNILFLSLGAMLYTYIDKTGFVTSGLATDDIYPTLALEKFGTVTAVCFLLGITASSYASSDSALASLTTAFCIDFLNFKKKREKQKKKQKLYVHLGFSILFFFIIIIYNYFSTKAVIDAIFTIAGYTYGPLLGMFAYGILTKFKVNDKMIPLIALSSPLLTYFLAYLLQDKLKVYNFSFELLIINALIMVLLMYTTRNISFKTKS